MEFEAEILGIKGKFKKEAISPFVALPCDFVYLKGSEKNTTVVIHGESDGRMTCNKIDGVKS